MFHFVARGSNPYAYSYTTSMSHGHRATGCVGNPGQFGHYITVKAGDHLSGVAQAHVFGLTQGPTDTGRHGTADTRYGNDGVIPGQALRKTNTQPITGVVSGEELQLLRLLHASLQ